MHAFATPLLTKADGTKFGKTEGGALWLDPELTSPYAFFQFWLNTDDRDVVRYLKVLSFRTREEIEELEKAVGRAAAGPGGAARAGRRAHGAGARRGASATRSWRPARRCSAGASWPTWTSGTLARRARRAAATGSTVADAGWPPLVDLLADDRAGAEQVGGPPRGGRGRCLREQRRGSTDARPRRRPATCCTGAGWCCAAASGTWRPPSCPRGSGGQRIRDGLAPQGADLRICVRGGL